MLEVGIGSFERKVYDRGRSPDGDCLFIPSLGDCLLNTLAAGIAYLAGYKGFPVVAAESRRAGTVAAYGN